MSSLKPICSICQDKLFNEDKIDATLCGHIFHNSCIRYALHRNPRCPICRVSSNRRDLIPLYFSSDVHSDSSVTTSAPVSTLSSSIASLKLTTKHYTSATAPAVCFSGDVKSKTASAKKGTATKTVAPGKIVAVATPKLAKQKSYAPTQLNDISKAAATTTKAAAPKFDASAKQVDVSTAIPKIVSKSDVPEKSEAAATTPKATSSKFNASAKQDDISIAIAKTVAPKSVAPEKSEAANITPKATAHKIKDSAKQVNVSPIIPKAAASKSGAQKNSEAAPTTPKAAAPKFDASAKQGDLSAPAKTSNIQAKPTTDPGKPLSSESTASRPARNMRQRRPTHYDRLNYKNNVCVFCKSSFVTAMNYVVCPKCIREQTKEEKQN